MFNTQWPIHQPTQETVDVTLQQCVYAEVISRHISIQTKNRYSATEDNKGLIKCFTDSRWWSMTTGGQGGAGCGSSTPSAESSCSSIRLLWHSLSLEQPENIEKQTRISINMSQCNKLKLKGKKKITRTGKIWFEALGKKNNISTSWQTLLC